MANKLVLDDFFKELFKKHIGKEMATDETLKEIETFILNFESGLIIDVANILKVANDMHYSFSACYKEIRKRLDSRLPKGEDKRDKFIVALATKYLIAHEADSIKEFVAERRDFVAEVVAQKLKISTDKVTEEDKNELLNNPNDVYSITDDPIRDWDKYFFNVCRQVARNSKCLSRRIGAVLVRDNSILTTGYNGPPRGTPPCESRWYLDPHFINKYSSKIVNPPDPKNPICPRYTLGAKSGELLDICVAGHAEENAILNAAWHGIPTKGATLYMTCGIPCFRCLIKIINAGISEIVVTGIKFYDDNSEFLLNNSKVKVRLYDFK